MAHDEITDMLTDYFFAGFDFIPPTPSFSPRF